LGHWKDYEELETSLSMQELIATLGAMHEKENRQNKFLAAIQGIDLSPDNSSSSTNGDAPTSLAEINARADKRLGGSESSSFALEFGISQDEGLGYEVLGLADING
jgi:hypothetical protein